MFNPAHAIARRLSWNFALVTSLLLSVGIAPVVFAQDGVPEPPAATSEPELDEPEAQELTDEQLRAIECNRLITVSNQAVSEVQSVTQTDGAAQIEMFLQISNIADRASAAMKIISLSDEQLDGFRQRFIAMYTDTSQAVRDLSAATRLSDEAAARQAYDAMLTATNQEAPLVNDVNAYCDRQAQQDRLQRTE
ncbi:hypothetical protein IQ268_01155 [Oculatella sp. LEGE 06141]|uniref:hypothetical protein n=1 Tax=Oculatella sp. LEGE 06141 TaxID=1828648 RepID=UPI00187DF3D0|nr:hypothetical protein [Oculatella sp. LEGE 06141]MBE9177182.1 hypothetical protein [Oculatella sp. LEGE 06141]